MSDEIQSSGPDLVAIANRLFPSSAPASAPAIAAPENSAAATVSGQSEPGARQIEAPASAKPAEAFPQSEEKVSGPAFSVNEPPEAVKALRADPVRRMFGAQGSFASVQIEESMAHLGLDPAVATAVAAEYREIFADLGASPQDAKELVNNASRLHAEPMTLERDATNTSAAIQMLNEHYGTGAKAALATAQEMIARDPRLARALEASRLGNDPKTVLKIVQLARSAKQRGEF